MIWPLKQDTLSYVSRIRILALSPTLSSIHLSQIKSIKIPVLLRSRNMCGWALNKQGEGLVKSYRTQPELRHSFEPSTHANYALVLITSPPLVPNKWTLLAATTATATTSGAKQNMQFFWPLNSEQFAVNRFCKPQWITFDSFTYSHSTISHFKS